MPQPGHSEPEIADLVALSAALERDERLPRSDRTRIDQAAGQGVTPACRDQAVLAMRWLDRYGESDHELQQLRERTREAVAWAGLFAAALGLLFGWLAAAGIFYFDGDARVNVIAIFAVFVILPGVLLIPFLLVATPRRTLEWIPGGVAIAALARGLSPGRLAFLLHRLLPRAHHDGLNSLFGKWERHERLFAAVQKWSVLRWSQLIAVGFQVAALTAALYLVVFSDLAFGWSTTLSSGDAELDAQRVHSITSAVAAPWSWAWPNAAPTVELVRESRYFRVAAEAVTPAQAARLGGWWPFVVMAMLIYGFLPRLLALAWASRQLRGATRTAFANMPGISKIVRRLRHLHLQTAAPEPERLGESTALPSGNAPAGRPSGCPPALIINWADVPVTRETVSAGFGEVPVHAAGGSSTLKADRKVIQSIAGDPPADTAPIVILVKSWEPPVSEFADFLATLRRAIGDEREIVVLPIGIGDGGRLSPAAETHLDIWRRRLAQAADPWLRVAATREEAG